MVRRYKSDVSAKQFRTFTKENLDRFTLPWQEGFSGWCHFGCFSVCYKSGDMSERRNIFTKAVGRIRRRNGEHFVSFIVFRGLTDPFSLLVLFTLSFIIIALTASQGIGPLPIGIAAFGAGLCTLLASGITFLFSLFHEEGQESAEELIRYLERTVAHKPLDQ
ncbi:hypothetical protein M6D81_30660 [Paenibacillus sp. J5C_2022]|uniref:hypothetical protein n=1 Tax=Paenibacillus sp. J5C2022 TaxID=2977129 RepID=UPI0021D193A6|nr:hypothetical protein [Paenibacillus sp. J5C2022]MCU6713070.1 hypothetical protein [Paenibacillus sp. J5C2022]